MFLGADYKRAYLLTYLEDVQLGDVECSAPTAMYCTQSVRKDRSQLSALPPMTQEAQLLHRDRPMLYVTEDFAKSLKVGGNGTIRKLWYGFLFACHSNYGHQHFVLFLR